jgi:hypothetical protein
VQLDERDPVAIDASMVEMARPQVGLRRVASVEDMRAQVVMFCRAELITSQVLAIDGGMLGGMY